MRTVICYLVAGVMILAGTLAGAKQTLPESVSAHSAVSPLLEKRVVHLQSSGRSAVQYAVATRMLQQDDVLVALQDAYARMLPEGEDPEFKIKHVSEGRYAYVNRKKEKTELLEILRVVKPEHVELYIFSSGDRFFGSFEALTAIHVEPTNADEINWEVQVYAYPQNVLSRLVARSGIVNRFFRNKTREITKIAIRIAMYMTANESNRI
jgi:hypothetical protein